MDESHRGKTMRKQAVYVMILSILLFAFIQSVVKTVSSSAPTKIQIYVGPLKVPADNKTYKAIYVQLQDSSNLPARAPTDIDISLSSSPPHYGSVDPKVTVISGSTYAVANFSSTFTPGSATITAAAFGFDTVQTSITTVGPVPTKLAVYGFPPTLPADGGAYKAVVVQLQDAGGSPAKAPIGDVNVTLTSSNVTVGTVDPSVVISAGSTYTAAMFYTDNNNGSAVVTAQASGYTSGFAPIKTESLSTNATKLKVLIGPPKVPADGVVYDMIAVQLQDSAGKIASAVGNVTVFLSSSDMSVGDVDSPITINDSTTYSPALFHSTYRSGVTTITAAAVDFTTGQEVLTTVGPIPSKLAVYCVPPKLPADGRSYEAITVQLQDSAGTPARDPTGDTAVELFSSTPEAGNVSSSVVILYSETYSVASFYSTYDAGSTDITALSLGGYTTGVSAITTYVIDQLTLVVSLVANPPSVSSGNQTTITVYVTYGGLIPAAGATVTMASNRGGNFSVVTDEENGNYTSVFTAPNVTAQTVCTISVNASKLGYITGHGTAQVTVNSTVNIGDLKLYIKETGGSPIEGATVTSTSQPSGISSLSAMTDSDGYVGFEGIPAGTYVFEITKDGFETTNETVQVAPAQAASYTINLTGSASGLPLPILIVVIIAVTLATGLAATLILRRRRKPAPEEEPAAEA